MWTRRWPSCLRGGVSPSSEITRLIEVGINHEQQHQELLLTDILALFAANPLRPAYRAGASRRASPSPSRCAGSTFPAASTRSVTTARGFAWDNETPAPRCARSIPSAWPIVWSPTPNGSISWPTAAIATAALWLADGWGTVNREGWQAPLYWEERDGEWLAMSLEGLQPVDRAAPSRM